MCEFEIAYRNYTKGKINYQTVAFNSQRNSSFVTSAEFVGYGE